MRRGDGSGIGVPPLSLTPCGARLAVGMTGLDVVGVRKIGRAQKQPILGNSGLALERWIMANAKRRRSRSFAFATEHLQTTGSVPCFGSGGHVAGGYGY